jgi:hypothetical protein
MTDSVSELLADLPPAAPDDARSDRRRSSCHAVLARHRSRHVDRRAVRRLWEPLVAGLGGLYVVAVILEALQVSGFR